MPPLPEEEPEDIFNDNSNIESDSLEELISNFTNSEQELLSEIIEDELEEYVSKKKLNHASAEVLTDMITEHLSCFLILGYDYEGNAVTIQNSSTQKDVDSLNTLIHKYIFTHATNMGKY